MSDITDDSLSDYEKVLQFLRQRCEEVQGEWNGDESGQLEDESNKATELLELLEEVDTLVRDLDL